MKNFLSLDEQVKTKLLKFTQIWFTISMEIRINGIAVTILAHNQWPTELPILCKIGQTGCTDSIVSGMHNRPKWW